MDVSDDQISAALQQAACTPEQLHQLLVDSDLEPSESAVADVRRLAERWGLDVVTVLYGLTSEDSPLFQDWS